MLDVHFLTCSMFIMAPVFLFVNLIDYQTITVIFEIRHASFIYPFFYHPLRSMHPGGIGFAFHRAGRDQRVKSNFHLSLRGRQMKSNRPAAKSNSLKIEPISEGIELCCFPPVSAGNDKSFSANSVTRAKRAVTVALQT
jgi:hypothetical protein